MNKALRINITKEDHMLTKSEAAKHGMSMTDYLVYLVKEQVKRDKEK